MDNADTELEQSDESIRHTFREQAAEQQFQQQLSYTSMKQAPMSNTDFYCRTGLRVFSFSV